MSGSYSRAWLTVFLLLLALLPSEGQAQYFGRNKVQYDNFAFHSFATEHYDVYYYPAEAKASQDAARMAERWYARHERTFGHSYSKKPLIFYANDADFQQTNVIEGFISQSVGGVTEALQNRVVMPLTGIYKETDHVLGHELIHTFQYDIVQSPEGGGLRNIGRAPLWLVEGMAEYLTIGRDDPHTAMWMRDAVLRDDLPSISDLNTLRYFPYRYGQAYMAYVGGRWGDEAVTNLFRLTTQTGLDSALVSVTGMDSKTLSKAWKRDIRQHYRPLLKERTPPEEAGRRVLARDIDAGDLNIAPAVSPDGRYVAFLSERGLFSISLYLADTHTGKVIEQLSTADRDPHFDALRFMNSAGTWSPDGKRFAYVVFAKGDNRINILDVESETVKRRIKIGSVGAISNPAWSPDGRYLAFSGIRGGISDLFLYDLKTGETRQLTDDRYADLQPEWSPDGRTLAFATDRGPGGTNFERLAYADPRLGFLNVETEEIEVRVPFEGAKHINPQFSPDGRSLYFVSDRNGFSNIYRLGFDRGQVFQVTDVATGVSGITDLAPALSVADANGLTMYSVFHDNQYTIFAKSEAETEGTPVTESVQGVPTAGLLPPSEALEDVGLVGQYLADPTTGLPELTAIDPVAYDPNLRLTYVGPPTIGVGYDTQFGAGVAGSVSFFFSDLLGNHLLGTSVQAQGSFRDVGGEVFYLYRENQWNLGAQVSHTPYVTGRTFVNQDPQTGLITVEQQLQRTFFTGGQLFGQYPFSTTRRFEAQVGYNRVWFDYRLDRLLVDPATGQRLGRETVDIGDPGGLNLTSTSLALVSDFSNFGFTSPVAGGRWRLEAGYTAGALNYGTLLADYRRYFFLRPFTFAIGAYHYGRYLGEDGVNQLYPLNVGYSMYNVRGVHGYGIYSFDVQECDAGNGRSCPVFDRIVGSRVAVGALELRYPLVGTSGFGLIDFPYLATELAVFGDVGLAWDHFEDINLEFARQSNKETLPVFSAGAAARVNLLGAVTLELFYAYPFQRPDQGWLFGLTLMRGW